MTEQSKSRSSRQELKKHLHTVTRAFRSQREELQELKTFVALQQQMLESSNADIGETMLLDRIDTAVGILGDTLKASGASLLVPDPDTGAMVFICVHGEHAEDLRWKQVDPAAGLVGWVARSRRAAVVNNARLDERFFDGIDDVTGFNTHSMIAVPLMQGAEVLGVLELVNASDRGLFRNREVGLVNLCAHFFSLMLVRLASSRRRTGTRKSRRTGHVKPVPTTSPRSH